MPKPKIKNNIKKSIKKKSIKKRYFFYDISQNTHEFNKSILRNIFNRKPNWVDKHNSEINMPIFSNIKTNTVHFSNDSEKSIINTKSTLFDFITIKYDLACFLNSNNKFFVNMYPNTFTLKANTSSKHINFKNKKKYLVKEPGANGKNIYPISKKNQIKRTNKNVVIQELLEDLDLYQNKKYDIRTYFVIIKQHNRFYFLNSREHICRIIPQNYVKGSTNLNNLLTNVNFHKNQVNYNPYKQINILSNIDKNNIRSEKVACLLRDFSINLTKTIHTNNDFVSNLRSSKPYECMFIGADIIFDNNLNPYIIEFNKSPAISSWNINNNIKSKFSKIFVDYVNHIIEPLLENKNITSNSSWNMLYSCNFKK